MGSITSFPSKSPAETKKLAFSFLSQLDAGVTVSSPLVTASVWTGVDPTPSAILSGSATAAGTNVTQAVTAGVTGTIYKLVCRVSTSDSQTLTQTGYLAIVADPI